ncbi:MAG: hypothetical protein JXB60_05705 [Candidatus Cloacimonetes bacterium]|nr:hypothetical protein [Candidatus Cloacimonadota bacterium]
MSRFFTRLLLTGCLAILLFHCTQREPAEEKDLKICSFNIQFLGHFKDKDDIGLAQVLKIYDVVVIQELVAPPCDGFYPDASSYSADQEARDFLQAMTERGFSYLLSEEDTGPGEMIHKITSATEWWICFYKPDKVLPAPSLPAGFLANDRSANPYYERVPYAFALQTTDSKLDFVLITVHLKPDNNQSERRKQELTSINEWIHQHHAREKDFIILGDMNIYDQEELDYVIPPGFQSLNRKCLATNTNPASPRPYDHVVYNPDFSIEVDSSSFQITDLRREMKSFWTETGIAYPGEPYDHDLFRKYYSDHNPVSFIIKGGTIDDD